MMDRDQVMGTLAAYALNLMHGGVLAEFEQDNLVALAAGVGVTARMSEMAAASVAREARRGEERERLRECVAACRDQFRRYEALHALKPDGAGQEKAAVNREMAEMCEGALQPAVGG